MKRETYLTSRALTGDWTLEGCAECGFAGAVVIPALAESANLMATLSSLACCPEELLQRYLVVVVVNHRIDASDADKQDNVTTLDLLTRAVSQFPALKLAWVDAASPGSELPLKEGGVGLARKLGCDLALPRLATNSDALLICLDADTLVRPDYLTALEHHFQHTATGAATIPFIHQPAAAVEGQQAIDRYELFLRSYVLGLELAGSPYAFHSVGSAMACRMSAYLKIGGMNSRAAGEDFYFLQQLARTVGVSSLEGTVVFPSPRSSHRVPFGTGRSILTLLDSGLISLSFYHNECFTVLKEWLTLVDTNRAATADEIIQSAGRISPDLATYLAGVGFEQIWKKLQRNHPRAERFIKAFHDWFDGLKTLRLIHHLSAGPFPRCEPEAALPPLFKSAGISDLEISSGYLETLRKIQVAHDYDSGGNRKQGVNP